MAQRWTTQEEITKRKELYSLYSLQNKTIDEIGRILGIAGSTVFDRLVRLHIRSQPERKNNYLNRRKDIQIPSTVSQELAEFTGILLGDGHISPTQIIISFHSEEKDYLVYVSQLAQTLFHIPPPKYVKRLRKNSCDLYIGSTKLVCFFKGMGLVSNKVREQVDIPSWIGQNTKYQQAVLRGLFDTDGSVYRIRFGFQMNFCNNSIPLLTSARNLLSSLGYHPSKISCNKIYLTRISDLRKYTREIGFSNPKHLEKIVRFDILFPKGRFV